VWKSAHAEPDDEDDTEKETGAGEDGRVYNIVYISTFAHSWPKRKKKMQAWVLPAAGAGAIALVILIVLAVFFCRRAIAERALREKDDGKTLSPLETGNLLLKEQALDRFVLFQLNLFSLAWSSEHSITHTHRDLVYFRRFVNILCVFLGLFAIGFADVIWQNWCCYPSSVSYADYSEGTCDAAFAGTNVTGFTPCSQMGGWIWFSNALFVGGVAISLLIHMYLSYNFVHDVRYGLDGNYTGIIDAIDDHGLEKEKNARLKKYTWMSFDHHTNVQKNTASFAPHEINLHRLGHLLIDPFAIIFGYPHIVMSRSDLAVANFGALATMLASLIALIAWAQPDWEGRCCYYDDNTRSGRYGLCSDSSAAISADPFRLKCSVLSWEMAILVGIFCIALLVSFGLWMYTFVLFHYILRKSSVAVLDKLDTLAMADDHLGTAWLAKSPAPAFDFHRS
jgi:hypothetical protein